MTSILLASLAVLLSASPDWPRFRGPTADGISPAVRVPLKWDDTTNVTWRTKIPGLGWSSPVVLENKVWVTTATEEGKSLRAIALDSASGKILHDLEVFRRETVRSIHKKNSHASPTPFLEPGKVYLHFGPNGTACLDAETGKPLWTTEIPYAQGHGPGGSPVVFRDLLYLCCDGTDTQSVVALDKATGKERWKTTRPGRMAYSTPLVIEVSGEPQLVTTSGNVFVAYRPEDGTEIWRTRHPGYSLVPQPVHAAGLVFLCSGYDHPTLVAVRPDGKGDVTDSHVAWTITKGAPLNPTPVFVQGRLHIVSDSGVAAALDPATGKATWQERLEGDYSASPVFAGSHLYFTSEDGVTTVIEPGEKSRTVSVNRVRGRTLASLAPVDGAIFLRTDTELLRIGEKAQ